MCVASSSLKKLQYPRLENARTHASKRVSNEARAHKSEVASLQEIRHVPTQTVESAGESLPQVKPLLHPRK